MNILRRRSLFVKRGYILLLSGILLGFLAFSAIGALYSGNVTSTGTGGTPTDITFQFLYTSEKQSWIEEVTPPFINWFKLKTGINVHVNLVVAGSLDTVNRILDGSTTPTVWSPASSIWIPYLNTKYRSVTGTNSDIATDYTPLVLSPLVLASWNSYLTVHNASSFIDLYNLAKSGVDFKYGHPDPLLSNGGTMTVIMEFAEAAGKQPKDLTVADLKNQTVINIVKTIESKAIQYGTSTGFFGSWATENGPSAIQFFGIYENVVLDNSLKAFKKWNDPIVAVYPSKGTLIADHPFVILNGNWVDSWQRFAAGQYLLYLLEPANQKLAETHGFRPASTAVPLDQTVFNPTNGVKPEIRVPALEPPTGEVLDAIFSAWTAVRNQGI